MSTSEPDQTACGVYGVLPLVVMGGSSRHVSVGGVYAMPSAIGPLSWRDPPIASISVPEIVAVPDAGSASTVPGALAIERHRSLHGSYPPPARVWLSQAMSSLPVQTARVWPATNGAVASTRQEFFAGSSASPSIV